MSDTSQQQAAAPQGTAELSFLDRAVQATVQTPADTTRDLMTALTRQAMAGTVSWDKNLTLTLRKAITLIDKQISSQLSEVMTAPDFRRLEGSWLGLHKLVRESDPGADLKIRMADYTKSELLQQFENAPAIDRSPFFNCVYQAEFGTAGGQPYGVLLGDFEFGYGDEDVALLRYIGEVASASHAPFVAAAGGAMFDFQSVTQFADGKPVAAGFDAPAYASWNAFRAADESRYVALTLPKTLARQPYGTGGKSICRFEFEELPQRADGSAQVSSQDQFVWSNAAYAYGLLLTQAYRRFGWCTAVRGAENGGKVDNLPNYIYRNDARDVVQLCPAQVNLTDEREKELSDLGFLPLVHYKNAAHGVFMGAQTVHKPKIYTDPAATANAAISARLPYVMASSRITQYLKVIGRDRVGSNLSAADVEKSLDRWLHQYVNPNAIGNEAKATHPLAEAKVTVTDLPGRPGMYAAVAWIRPWLQMEALTASLRMVADIPGG